MPKILNCSIILKPQPKQASRLRQNRILLKHDNSAINTDRKINKPSSKMLGVWLS
jgi:hypothetical protein